jgi:hypothetical protein
MDKLMILSVSMKKLLSLFFVIILAGCGPVTPIVSATKPSATSFVPIDTGTTAKPLEPAIRFLSPNLLIVPDNHNLNLNAGIFALNKDIIFLLGNLGTQSTLLRSNDAGKNWIEIMEPIKGSSVTDFQMLPTGEGWVTVMWFWESPGNTSLFYTTNFGDTWELIYDFPKPSVDTVLANLAFFDEDNGQVLMLVTNSLNDRIAFLTTTDGGKSWQETSSYVPPFEDKRVFLESLTEIYYENKKDYSQSWGLDYSSHWKIETTDAKLNVYRQLVNPESNSWNDWELMNSLPLQYGYQNFSTVHDLGSLVA